MHHDDHAEPADIERNLVAREASHPPRAANAARAGIVPAAALLAASRRLADPTRYGRSDVYDRLAAPSVSWYAGPADPSWWRAAAEADRLALAHHPAAAGLIEAALAAAPDADTKEAVRGLLMARFTARFEWNLADRVEEAAACLPRPGFLRRIDAVLHTIVRRRFTLESVEEVRAFLEDGPDDPWLRHRLRDHLWMAEGPTEPLLAGALADAAAAEDVDTGIAAGQAVSLALALHGTQAAREIVDQHPQAWLQGRRMLPLAAVLSEEFPAEAALHDRSLAQTERLREVLSDPHLRVAVVGNGMPSQNQAGAAIDAHDLIIRFNDFRLTEWKTVLGRRTDLIGTSLLKWEGFRQPHLGEAAHGAMLLQHRAWVGLDWQWVVRAQGDGVPIGFFPDDELRQALQRRLGVFLSSGLLLLALLRHLRGPLDPESVFCMPLLGGAGDARRTLGDLSHNGHIWEREAAVFRELLAA